MLITRSGQPQTLKFTYRAMKDIPAPKAGLVPIEGWQAKLQSPVPTGKVGKGNELDFSYLLTPGPQAKAEGKQSLTAYAGIGEQQFSYLMRTINYDHIPHVNYFKKPVVNLLSLDIKITGKKIGYIEGAGDNVPLALQQMGYEVTILTDYDLGNSDLTRYDAILTGVRAYNVKESLNTYYDKLMRYVEQGGNLVVQYNTSSQIGPVRAKIGPYPFNIARTRITDEKAVVNVLKPEHKVMNFPNKITAKDFDGWVQERSIYHADNLDAHYEKIFSMSDPGDKPDEGSLVIANYGKGNFVYTGLVFFRELPAGVTGAYRLLANIIALNQKRGF